MYVSVLAWAQHWSGCVHAPCAHTHTLPSPKGACAGRTLYPVSPPHWERGPSGLLPFIHFPPFPPDPQAGAMPARSAPTCAAGGP